MLKKNKADLERIFERVRSDGITKEQFCQAI